MKVFIDPRNSLYKDNVGVNYYQSLGCKKVALYKETSDSLAKKLDSDKIITADKGTVFVDNPKNADLVLVLAEQYGDYEYLFKDDDLEEIASKSEQVREAFFEEPIITRFNPILYMFCNSLWKINIGPNVEEINDCPNAFTNCKQVKDFKVDKGNKRYTDCYFTQPSLSFTGIPTGIAERNYVDDNGRKFELALHTFPAVINASNLDRLSLNVQYIEVDAFITQIQADFITLNSLEGLPIFQPQQIGQRVIFICEGQEAADFLLSLKIKAIDERDFLMITRERGSIPGRQCVKDAFDQLFINNRLYVNGAIH